MSQPIPAAAQYAASAAPVFPLEVAMQCRLPLASMSATAAAAKRSLYEPVGLLPSSLKNSSVAPAAGPMRRERTSGVSPSPSVMRHASGARENRSAQRQMLMGTAPGGAYA